MNSGDDLETMLRGTMDTKLSCLKCGTKFTFEEGAQFAMAQGIHDKVVMCPKCHNVYRPDVTSGGIILGTAVSSVNLSQNYLPMNPFANRTAQWIWLIVGVIVLAEFVVIFGSIQPPLGPALLFAVPVVGFVLIAIVERRKDKNSDNTEKTQQAASPKTPKVASVAEDIDTIAVESLVQKVRELPPTNPYCFVVLFGDRPLTAKQDGECILAFATQEKSDEFLQGYQQFYMPTQPLTTLALNDSSELWALLNNSAQDPMYKPPYGLIVNFNYSGAKYSKYGVGDIQRIGSIGLKRSLDRIL